MAFCFDCPYLAKEIGYCTNPAFNGRALKLKQKDGKYIKICKLTKNKIDKPLNSLNCNPKCAYLNCEYGIGICISPELKDRERQLRKDENGHYLKKCSGLGFNPALKEKNKTNKYHSKKVVVDSVQYDSQLEYDRYCELKLLEKAGIIKNLEYHKKYILINKNENGREIAYEADFVYEKDGKLVVEDTKSEPTKTRLYKLKKRLMLERYGIKITEYTRKGGNYYGKELLCNKKGINLSGSGKNMERVSGLN